MPLEFKIGDHQFVALVMLDGAAPELRRKRKRISSRPGKTGHQAFVTRTEARLFRVRSIDYVASEQAAKDLMDDYHALKTGLPNGTGVGTEGHPPPVVYKDINYGAFDVVEVHEIVRIPVSGAIGGIAGKEPHAVRQEIIWTLKG